MGPYSPFDRYLVKAGRLVAVAEIKTRTNRTLETFPTVYINLDKWVTLTVAEAALRVAGLFVIAFSDGIYWVRVGRVPLAQCEVGRRGRTDRKDVTDDVVPAVELPTSLFRNLAGEQATRRSA